MRRSCISLLLAGAAITACGNDHATDPDAPAGNFPPPRVIPGGGIGDGAIDGVVNLYVIDDATRMPVSGATVRVGTTDGTTDATGLFVANDLKGPQTIAVKASSYRSEVWAGANGANVTINLQKANKPAPAAGTVTGTILGWTGLTVPAGHAKVALFAYSQSDDLGDDANNIAQPNNQNVCISVQPNDPCNYTVTSRTGKVAVVAAIFDRDLNGTPNNPDDDTSTLIRWAVRQNVNVTDGGTAAGSDLALVSVGMQQMVTVDFGSPPASAPTVGALVGIDLGEEGVAQLPTFAAPQAAQLLVPRPEAFTNANGYRLTAIASNGSETSPTQSVVLRRGLTGPTLSAGEWLSPPTSVSLTRTGGTWSAVSGAVVQSIELTQGSTGVLSVTIVDNAGSFMLPDLITLPSGALTALVQGIGATGLDIQNFSLDADRTKLDRVAAQGATIN